MAGELGMHKQESGLRSVHEHIHVHAAYIIIVLSNLPTIMYSAPALYGVATTVAGLLKAVLLTARIFWFAITCTCTTY